MASSQGRVWGRSPHPHSDHSNLPLDRRHNNRHCHHCLLHVHHHHCSHCPLHDHLHHFQPQLPFTSLPLNPHLLGSHPNSGALDYKKPHASHTQISQELHYLELGDDEEKDEPVFVLTDEWREFFAKSEARRKKGFGHG